MCHTYGPCLMLSNEARRSVGEHQPSSLERRVSTEKCDTSNLKLDSHFSRIRVRASESEGVETKLTCRA